MENEFESTENNTNQEQEHHPQMQITEDMRSYLYEAAKWSKVIALFGIFLSILILIIGVFGTAVVGSFELLGKQTPMMDSGSLMIFFIFYAVLIFTPSFFLYRFSTKTITGILYLHPDSLTEGFNYLKRLFKFQAILILVAIAIYLLAFISVLAKF